MENVPVFTQINKNQIHKAIVIFVMLLDVPLVMLMTHKCALDVKTKKHK